MSCSPTNHPGMCFPFSLNLEKHEWSWDNAAHREMPEACRRLSYVFNLHWVINRRVHSLSLYLTIWNTWMNYSCFKHYSSNALQWTCFFHKASPSTRSFIQRFLTQAKFLWVVSRSSALWLPCQLYQTTQSNSLWLHRAVVQQEKKGYESWGTAHIRDQQMGLND